MISRSSFAFAVIVAGSFISSSVVAQQCEQNTLTCAAKCVSADECKLMGEKYTWNDLKCPGEKCGCCEEILQCEESPNCFGGKCISREECAEMGVKYTWVDETCPGEKCGCCKEVDPCFGTASMCPNGACISREECAEKGTGYTWNDDKCPGETCGCCEETAPCLPTSPNCPNGKCISREECAKYGDTFTWNEKNCPGEDCGCCQEVKPCVTSSDTCPNGKCISREECAKAGREYTWSDEKCSEKDDDCGCCERIPCLTKDPVCEKAKGQCFSTGSECPTGSMPDYSLCGASKECFCCVPQCFRDPECSQFPNGRCVKSAEECKNIGPSFIFSEKMCRREGAADATCGCCYSNCLEKDELCNEKGGKCVANKDMCQGIGFTFVSTLCQVDPTTGVSTCGCCIPPCKKKDENCEMKGGKCVPHKDKCQDPNFIFDETLCRTDVATGETTCGCCYPKPKECLEVDQPCRQKGGKCVPTEDDCKTNEGFTFDKTLCRTDAATGETTCGCCIPPPPPCMKVDRLCKQKKGKCTTDKESCLETSKKGMIFDDSLCRTEDTTSVCGCCYQMKPCKLTRGCAARKGKCVSKSSLENSCNLDTNDVDMLLCGGETSDCACCYPKAV